MQEKNVIIVEEEKAPNSRVKIVLIKEAIGRCPAGKTLNVYVICKELGEILEERYQTEDCLEYHAKRMGLFYTKDMVKQIESYIGKSYDGN
ncbi:hypothetical protein KGF51_12280 [Clostridioides sp. ZZV14-6045]|uniref:hypothetical protein n=1 Tax=Clostridioides sp. ZZV14-6045 TaxID=2811489 RepID=UPI001D10AF37|nr:hypothetical protein [Clostridioides sp. ZZV14-6045]